MKNARVIIGANYGDEGKGLATAFFCRQPNTLNVLTNGGCQRGHTVVYNKHRVIFSHLGSGFFTSDCLFSKYYMVNPMVFVKEYNQFVALNEKVNTIYIDGKCTLTTPYDMFVNRIVEDRRENRHGSCGYGIWETLQRNKKYPIVWEDLFDMTFEELKDKFVQLRDTYFIETLKNYDITMNDSEKAIFYSNILIENYVNDLLRMQNICVTTTFNEVAKQYDNVVFENAQGLLLDMAINKLGTPSRPGMAYIEEMLEGYDIPITPCYITRTYLTKHGNGDFPQECDKDKINPDMEDLTNHPNQYQGTLRYGMFDEASIKKMIERITKDANGRPYDLVVTHLNEYNNPTLVEYATYTSDNEEELVCIK